MIWNCWPIIHRIARHAIRHRPKIHRHIVPAKVKIAATIATKPAAMIAAGIACVAVSGGWFAARMAAPPPPIMFAAPLPPLIDFPFNLSPEFFAPGGPAGGGIISGPGGEIIANIPPVFERQPTTEVPEPNPIWIVIMGMVGTMLLARKQCR